MNKVTMLLGIVALVVGSLLLARAPRDAIAPPVVASQSAAVGDLGEATTLDDSALAEVRGQWQFGGLELLAILFDVYWQPESGWQQKFKDFLFGPDNLNIVQI